jgi:hypothetical protein
MTTVGADSSLPDTVVQPSPPLHLHLSAATILLVLRCHNLVGLSAATILSVLHPPLSCEERCVMAADGGAGDDHPTGVCEPIRGGVPPHGDAGAHQQPRRDPHRRLQAAHAHQAPPVQMVTLCPSVDMRCLSIDAYSLPLTAHSAQDAARETASPPDG